MCGIAATYSKDKRDMRADITNLLKESEMRGSDASGIACVDSAYKKNRILYHKAPVRAGELIAQDAYKKFIDSVRPISFIAHARAKTKGVAEDNNNNHPILTASGITVVHNGIVTNDEDITEEYALKRRGQVDSEVIPLLIEQFVKEDNLPVHRAIIKMASIVRGSMACAVLSASDPTSLWVFGSTSPLVMAFNKNANTLYFASTKSILSEAIVQYEYALGLFPLRSNIDDFSFIDGEDNVLYHVKPDTIDQYEITRPTGYYYANNGQLYGSKWNDGTTPLRIGGKNEEYYTSVELERRLEVLEDHVDRGLATKRERKEMRKIKRKLEIRTQLQLKDVN